MSFAPIQGSDWLKQLNDNFNVISTGSLIQLASVEETQAGEDATKGITPAGLAAMVSGAAARGMVELATDAETITGTDAERAVTPAGLAALTSSATRKGLVELATTAEALAGTDTARAVTPAGLATSIGKIFPLSFAGRSGSGACACPGTLVDDKVLGVTSLSAGSALGSLFESVVTVQDEIQQVSEDDHSSGSFIGLFHRLSA